MADEEEEARDTFDINGLSSSSGLNNNNNDPLLLLLHGGESSSPAAANNAKMHMQTYTAGEDNSRLANIAKELGLQKSRKPRRQVRRAKSNSHFTSFPEVMSLLLDSATEDARMLAVYSLHSSSDDENRQHVLDAHAHAEGGKLGGDLTSAILGTIKVMVGPAILYLPHGFATAGYCIAIPIMIITTFMFLYSSSCLLDSWKIIEISEHTGMSNTQNSENTPLLIKQQQQQQQRKLLSYPELAYRALGTTGESIVKLGIAMMQSGVCLTYLIFVPQNIHTSMKYMLNLDISPSFWLLLMIGIQIPLSWIRDIRKLTPTNLVANILILYGLSVCLFFAIQQSLQSGDVNANNNNDNTKTANSSSSSGRNDPLSNLWDHLADLSPFAQDWFLFIGTSVLLFEGTITLLVPLQESIDTEEDRAKFPSVFPRVIASIICFYAFFGITNWMAFGDDVRTVLTTSLPDCFLATTVQLAYSIAVIFTFPLQNFPALEITTRSIMSSFSSSNNNGSNNNSDPSLLWWYKWSQKRNLWSSVLVGALAIVAVCTMDSLDKVVSLMGSLLGCPIAFVFPPIIHSVLDKDITTFRWWCNRIVACLGVCAMVLASLVTLLTWS